MHQTQSADGELIEDLFQLTLCGIVFPKFEQPARSGFSSFSNANQTDTAQTASPEVPLMLTSSNSSLIRASHKAFSAPAVNAV
jgi:hypothetical protein